MIRRTPSPKVVLARYLRHAQTEAENRLWLHLRSRQVGGAKFRRQRSIGPFIVDFCCLDPKLVVEVDGGQHAKQVDEDADRSEFLEKSGYRVLRFWNNEMLQNTEAVVERIAEEVAGGQWQRIATGKE